MLLDLHLQQMNLTPKKIDGYSPLFIYWSASQRRKTDSHHKSFLCAPPVLFQTDCTSRVIWKLTVSRSSLQMKSSCYKNDLSSRWPFWHLSAKGKLRFGTSRWLWRGTSGSWGAGYLKGALMRIKGQRGGGELNFWWCVGEVPECSMWAGQSRVDWDNGERNRGLYQDFFSVPVFFFLVW